VFHQYTIRITGGNRDGVQQYLAAEGIGSMIYYPIPQDKLPVYQGEYPVNPVSDLLATEVLSLPIWPELESEKIEVVVKGVDKAMK
jgi:dTDP-4-amino-4,6-dideoxygalactose transaminase